MEFQLYQSLGNSIVASSLIKRLITHQQANPTLRFPFERHLTAFADRISSEADFIKLTFPEFTDHSSAIHFPNLFRLANVLLGEPLIGQLYAEETFVLAAGLYGHDWGMAVSPGEKELILTGRLSEGVPDKLWVMNHERERFTEFAREYNVSIDAEGFAPNLPETYWREYVRRTHAERSAYRSQKWFEEINGGVAQSVAALCIGHWLNLEAIDSEEAFPASLNVLDQRINLRALVLFIRLIDLFDIAEDRTPFAIWRFVSPCDPRSQREWSKHRSLRPVNTEPYLQSRCLVVDGTAANPEVYAELLDLRDYCELQLRGTCDLLARHPDPRLPFNLAPILHWRVKAQGFTPTEIRFEFDRERMFEILGGEIYQRDCFVFLRELLQNSIDAIRIRKGLQKKTPREGVMEGLIEFNVTHHSGGGCTVECRDNGIGMDDYIIRTYLAVAGRSYYQSHDLDRLGIDVDPISRFGIGILSCFVVASEVEITTRRDPRFSKNAIARKIEIRDRVRQWRIYEAPHETPVGTTVKIEVRGDRLLDDSGVKMEYLPVGKYLCAIAGFVEIPVLVRETNHYPLLILHPDTDAAQMRREFEEERKEFGGDLRIHQLSPEYPVSSAFYSEQVRQVKDHFAIDSYDIAHQLAVPNCEGFISFLVSKNPDWDPSPMGTVPFNARGLSLIERGTGRVVVESLRPKNFWHDYGNSFQHNLCPSAQWSESFRVFVDGILRAKVRPPQPVSIFSSRWALPYICINIKDRSQKDGDVARLSLRDTESPWDKVIWEKLASFLWREKSRKLASLDPIEQLYQFNRTANEHFIAVGTALDIHPIDKWPFIVLDSSGGLSLREKGDVLASELPRLPHFFSLLATQALFQRLILKSTVSDTLWRGDPSFVGTSGDERSFAIHSLVPSTLNTGRLMAHPIRLQFCRPPSRELPPIIQEVICWRERGEPNPLVEFLQRSQPGSIDFGRMLPEVKENRHNILGRTLGKVSAIPFAKPFEEYFAFGSDALNLNHPSVQAIVWALAFSDERRRPNDDTDFSPTRIDELWTDFHVHSLMVGPAVVGTYQNKWESLWTALMSIPDSPVKTIPAYPDISEFVPGSWTISNSMEAPFSWTFHREPVAIQGPFGHRITEWPLSY